MSNLTPAVAAIPEPSPSPEEPVRYQYFARFNPREYYYAYLSGGGPLRAGVYTLLLPNMHLLCHQGLIDSHIGACIWGFLTRWHHTLPPRLRVRYWNQVLARVPAEMRSSHVLTSLEVRLPFPGEPGFVMTSPPLPLVYYLLQREVPESKALLRTPLIDEDAFPGVVFPRYPTPLPDDVDELASERGTPVPLPQSSPCPLSTGQTLTLATAYPPLSMPPVGPPTTAPPPYQALAPQAPRPATQPPPFSGFQPPAVRHGRHQVAASLQDLQQTLRNPSLTSGNTLPSAATFLDLNRCVTASLPVLPTPPTPGPRCQPQPQRPLSPDPRLPPPSFSVVSTRTAQRIATSSCTPRRRLHSQARPPLPPVVGEGEFSVAPIPPASRGGVSTPRPQEPLFFPSSEEEDGHRPPSTSPPLPPPPFGDVGNPFDDMPVVDGVRVPSPELIYNAVSSDLVDDHNFDVGSPVTEIPKRTTRAKGKAKATASSSKRRGKKGVVQKANIPPVTPPRDEDSAPSPPPSVHVRTSSARRPVASPGPEPVAGPSRLSKRKKQSQAATPSTPPAAISPPHVPLTRSRAAATKAAILPSLVKLPEESGSDPDDDVPPRKKRRVSEAKKEKKKKALHVKEPAKKRGCKPDARYMLSKPGADTGVVVGHHSTSCAELEVLTFDDIREGLATFFKPVRYGDKNGTFGACSDPFPYFTRAPDVPGDCVPCSTRGIPCTWTNRFPGAACDQCTSSHHGRCSARYTAQEMNKVSSKLAKYTRYNIGSMESDLKELRALNHDLEHLDVLMRRNFLRRDRLIHQLADSLDQIAGHENGNAIIEGLASTYEEVSSFVIDDGIRRSLGRPLNLPKPGESSHSVAGSKSKSPTKGDESEADLDPNGSSASSSGSSSSSD
ncbi:uncharacterized protein EV420DRAFT_1649187 [Desarmillaria tabescens]|uniref:Uncharacterized protein n=1 Tax=Armillaria tabescens TaxID=1929756 RepID=A0AA39MQV3_ARMTA|nr:uncharacterized protein EV420DRAFT_1649187 [Desarmillaria tabescens]KAK0443716.1 hypothetical protein EV420DRAFT_1649187 [Desarmillaria tabescens]